MPVSIARLRELIDLAGSGGVEAIDVVEEGTHIRISRTGTAPIRTLTAEASAAAKPKAAEPHRDILASPMFGVLHLTPAPGAKPFVTVGAPVAKGQQLCLIEAMKMFNPIHSDRDGRLEAILAEPGTEVDNGQPLFRITRA